METLSLLKTMQAYATAHHIPIIEDESIQWFTQFLAQNKVKKILEIGGAIGYSTIYFQYLTQGQVVSVEKDSTRYDQAQCFLRDFSAGSHIKFIHADAKDAAFLTVAAAHAPYDLLFIDATKRNNQAFFELFAPLVAHNGYIVTDNLDFRGLIHADSETIAQLPRRFRPMIRAVIDYRKWLSEHKEFTTEFIALGDGLAVSQKRG
jgi:predicted O-methyltransferase YrrM